MTFNAVERYWALSMARTMRLRGGLGQRSRLSLVAIGDVDSL